MAAGSIVTCGCKFKVIRWFSLTSTLGTSGVSSGHSSIAYSKFQFQRTYWCLQEFYQLASNNSGCHKPLPKKICSRTLWLHFLELCRSGQTQTIDIFICCILPNGAEGVAPIFFLSCRRRKENFCAKILSINSAPVSFCSKSQFELQRIDAWRKS